VCNLSKPDPISEKPNWITRHLLDSTNKWTTFCPWLIWRVPINYKSFTVWMARWFCIFNWRKCGRRQFNAQLFLEENQGKPGWITNFWAEFGTENSEIGCKVLKFDHENSWRVMRSNLVTGCLGNWIHRISCLLLNWLTLKM
jgi:hypothetical protein